MKLVIIVGTRPQFLKLCPLSKELTKSNISYKIIHTGQHYDKEMSENLFKILQIKEPDYLLQKEGNTNIQCLGNMMNKIEEICLKEKPDKIIVFGDCDSTIAGAIVAKKLKIYLIHIEAGMRSYNKDMPEEINRLMTDHISDLLLCSTQDSVEKLKAENITKNVHYVGNLQLELLKNVCDTYNDTTILSDNNLTENNFALLTIHREYNTNKEMLNKIFLELEKLNIEIVFPIHPRTKSIVETNNITIPNNLKLIKPVNYLDMTILERNCKFIITDSGGVQPEAWFLGKKCVVMRSETEWIEPLNNNNNVLYDYKTSLDKFIEDFLKIKIEKCDINCNVSIHIINKIKKIKNKKKIFLIIGEDLNFIKAVSVYEALKEEFEITLIHTGGQYFEKTTNKVFFEQLKFIRLGNHLSIKKTKAGDFDEKLYINNDEYLKNKDQVIKDLISYTGELGRLGEIRDKLKLEFEKSKPDLVIVFGDVLCTLAASLVSKMLNIDMAHVESGLRTGNIKIPNEVNGILTDHITKYYFVTEQSGVDNLKESGIIKNVFLVGNTTIDIQKKYLQQALNTKYHEILDVKEKEYILISLTLPSNVDNMEKLKEIFDDLIELSKTSKLVYLIHSRTKKNLERLGYFEKIIKNENIVLQDPLGYLEFTCLMVNSKYIVVDSSGLQEESNVLNKPCFTLRENTKRPSTLIENGGTNKLISKISEIEKYYNEIIKNIFSNKINNFISVNAGKEIKNIIYSLYHPIIIPLGYGCRNSQILKKINLRKFSLPFDYLNCDLKVLLNIMKDNFIFANEKNLIINNNFMYSKIYGMKSKIFLHYNDKYRYISLINRFKNILKTPNINFISIYLNNGKLYRTLETYIHQYIELNEYITNNYNVKIKCVIINTNKFWNDVISIQNTDISNDTLDTPLEICNQIKKEYESIM